MERKITEQTDSVTDTAQETTAVSVDQTTLSERVWNEVLTEPHTFNTSASDSTAGSKCGILPSLEMDMDCETLNAESPYPFGTDDKDIDAGATGIELYRSGKSAKTEATQMEDDLRLDLDHENAQDFDLSLVSGTMSAQTESQSAFTPYPDGSHFLPISAGASTAHDLNSLPISAGGSEAGLKSGGEFSAIGANSHTAPQPALDLHYALLDVEQSIAALAAGMVADNCSFNEGQINLLRNAIMLKVGCERRHAHHIAAAAAGGASAIRQAQAMSDARRTSERLDRIIAILSANSNQAGLQPQ